MIRTLLAAASAAAVLSAAGAAAATTLSAASDSAFTTLTGAGDHAFTKQGGVSVRAGLAGSGDWEYAVVNGSDFPIGAPGQVAWGSGSALDPAVQPFASYTSAGLLSLAFARDGTTYGASGQVGAGVDTIWIRARTGSATTGSTAFLQGLHLSLTDGSLIALGDLTGDANAEYLGFADLRLRDGFSLSFDQGAFQVGTATRSNVMLQVKVGSSPIAAIPEPGTWALMIGGFGLTGAALRRRALAAA